MFIHPYWSTNRCSYRGLCWEYSWNWIYSFSLLHEELFCFEGWVVKFAGTRGGLMAMAAKAMRIQAFKRSQDKLTTVFDVSSLFYDLQHAPVLLKSLWLYCLTLSWSLTKLYLLFYIAQISMCIWSKTLYNIYNLCYYISTKASIQ